MSTSHRRAPDLASQAETWAWPSMANTLPSAITGGAVTKWARLRPATPSPRRQAICRFGAAATCSTDCSGVPPGNGHSAMGAGGGREKSWPFSAADGATTSCGGRTGIRSPWVATDLLVDLSKMLAFSMSAQPDSPTDRVAAMVRARYAAPVLAKALNDVIERVPVGLGPRHRAPAGRPPGAPASIGSGPRSWLFRPGP